MKTRPENDASPKNVEWASLDLRYESHRMKDAAAEGRLLASIVQRGIEEPLEGVTVEALHVLLNGFKRYRCARKLQLQTVPYASLGADEVTGILNLLSISKSKSLGILEQAAFIDELKSVRHLSVEEIAAELSVSKSWVSTLITSNLGFSEWGSFLKNDHLTAALIDRLTETSHVFNMKQCQGLRPILSADDELRADPQKG